MNARPRLPDIESLGLNFTLSAGDTQGPAGMEMAMDECVSGKAILSLFRRFESLRLPLAPSCRPM
jgi:hypothetical protein